jgi:hypothetical protein
LVNFHLFSRVDLSSTSDLKEVKRLSNAVLEILNKKSVVKAIGDAHVFGASSHSIQKAILAEMLELGFTSEKKLLFSEYKVGGLRPDYYKPLSKGGILFEVERGKTIANNMDLLDVWKTHICKEANHLFLLVPNIRVSKNQNEAKIFPSVKNRIETFFNENISAIDVDSVHLFGY